MKSLGSYNSFPYYFLTDNPSDFYVFRRLSKDGGGECSGWIKGRADLWHKLFNMKDKTEFRALCDRIFECRPKNILSGQNSFKE
jgi:hypothetical protein